MKPTSARSDVAAARGRGRGARARGPACGLRKQEDQQRRQRQDDDRRRQHPGHVRPEPVRRLAQQRQELWRDQGRERHPVSAVGVRRARRQHQAAGFDFDVASAICAKLGVKLDFVNTGFDSIILSLKSGKNNMAMSDMYDIPSREAQGVSFVEYCYDTTAILVVKGNPQHLTNLDSLAGKTVCCEIGTTQQALLGNLNKTFASSGKSADADPGAAQPACGAARRQDRARGLRPDRPLDRPLYRQDANNGNTYAVVIDPAAPKGYYPLVVGIASRHQHRACHRRPEGAAGPHQRG